MVLTLHDYRWPFAAARASLYILLLAALGVADPANRGYRGAVVSRTAHPFQLLNRDIVILATIGTTRSDLAWLRLHNPASRVILSVPAGTSCGEVRPILKAVRDVGYRRIILETRSNRTFLERRLAAGTAISRDATRRIEPPYEGFMMMEDMWY